MTELSEETLQAEFNHARGVTYLDHAGATLYSSKQLQDHMSDLASNLYSNPHSGSPSSKQTTGLVDSTRELVLRHFHTDSDHYDVVFTAGCTAALNLLSHAFPWQGESLAPSADGSCGRCSHFYYLDDNHTSVVGMREVACKHGARTVCVSAGDIKVGSAQLEPHSSSPSPPQPHPLSPPHYGPHHLFAYPAQSNFSGYKYPLTWCRDIPSGRLLLSDCDVRGAWLVVLDAASFVSTSLLDLFSCPPHFVTLSFYKMFGFPTGLGALLVRKDCTELLSKHYYGGGTVKATDSWNMFHVLKDQLHDRMEDGTLPFLDILALRHGFAALTRLGRSMEAIHQHTFNLARMVYSSLRKLRHDNGSHCCLLYSETEFEDDHKQGPIVNFNLLKPDGQALGYGQVEKLACVFDIHLRTGCFCNTGACMRFLGLKSETLKYHLEQGHECGDSLDLINGKPTGSVRISFGYMSTQRDANKFLDFIKHCFVQNSELNPIKVSAPLPRRKEANGTCDNGVSTRADSGIQLLTTASLVSCSDPVQVTLELDPEASTGPPPFTLKLRSITLYPVKSCAGFRVQQWPLGEKGLVFDREWMVMDECGRFFSLKQEPRLCLIHPYINLKTWSLTLAAEGYPCLTIPAPLIPDTQQPPLENNHTPLSTRVCGDRIQGIDCGDVAGEWLTEVLGKKCRLVRQNPHHRRKVKHGHIPDEKGLTLLSLANEAQYLMLSQSSLEQLLADISRNQPEWMGVDVDDLTIRFRANFVVGKGKLEVEPFVEEKWREIRIGDHLFQVTGKCVRCQMVCVDPETGSRSPEPLKTLLTLRGSKASFGMYLYHGTETSP